MFYQGEPSWNILYLSFLRSPIGTGLTEIRGNVEMEPCDWLLANEDVSRLSGDCGGVMRLGLLHSEWESEPSKRGARQKKGGEKERERSYKSQSNCGSSGGKLIQPNTKIIYLFS